MVGRKGVAVVRGVSATGFINKQLSIEGAGASSVHLTDHHPACHTKQINTRTIHLTTSHHITDVLSIDVKGVLYLGVSSTVSRHRPDDVTCVRPLMSHSNSQRRKSV